MLFAIAAQVLHSFMLGLGEYRILINTLLNKSFVEFEFFLVPSYFFYPFIVNFLSTNDIDTLKLHFIEVLFTSFSY